jgi:hypothetical protein
MTQIRTVITDLVVGESPRWHDGRLWFARTGRVQAVEVSVPHVGRP